MKELLLFEINRLKHERVKFFALLLLLLSIFSAIQAIKLYRAYEVNVEAGFKKIEEDLFKSIRNYEMYTIKGFRVLKKPPSASIAIEPNIYNNVVTSKINSTFDKRYIRSVSDSTVPEIPYLLILMCFGGFYGVSIAFSTKGKVNTFLLRLSILLITSIVIISPRIITLFFVEASYNDLLMSLLYCFMILLFVIISFSIGVVAKLYKMKEGVTVFMFFCLLLILNFTNDILIPHSVDDNELIQSQKFRMIVDFQEEEGKKFAKLKTAEEKREAMLKASDKYFDTVYKNMSAMEKDSMSRHREILKKKIDFSMISPLAFASRFREKAVNGNMFLFSNEMMELERQFMIFVLKSRYGNEGHIMKRFEKSNNNIYMTTSILPHNFWLGAFIYSSIFILVSGFVFFKLTRKPVPLEELKMRPGFLYREEMPDDIRARVKANAIAHGYFCIDDESIASYPGELTFSEIFSLNFYTKELLTEKVGDFFNTKLKNLEKSDLVTSLIILAVLTFDKVVIDNIGSSYSIKVKRKITYLVDELKSKGQIILYLSNSRTTLNISDPPDVKEVRFRDRFLPVETEYDLI